MINIKARFSKLFSQIIKLSLIFFITGLIFLLMKVFLESLLNMFLMLALEDSILFSLVEINYSLLIELSFFIALFLLLSSLILCVPLVFLREFHVISQANLDSILYFIWKCAATAYPTLVLAAALNESSFSLITNFISFFVIFSFIFKSNFFSKKK